jgi:outer membrane immunogenic protein
VKQSTLRLVTGASAIVASAILVPGAQAADLSPAYKAPVLAPATVSWTGFYVGGNVGWAHSNSSESNATDGVSTLVTLFGLPLTLGSASTNYPGAAANNNAVGAGAQIGYNYEIARVVLGIEADIQATNLNARFNNSASFLVPGGFTYNLTSQVSTKTDWFATVRGRLGYSFGAFMPYVTGGVAISQAKVTLASSGSVVDLGFEYPAASDSMSKTLVGYAVGGGMEYALGRGWSIKGEYLHLGFLLEVDEKLSCFSFASVRGRPADTCRGRSYARAGTRPAVYPGTVSDGAYNCTARWGHQKQLGPKNPKRGRGLILALARDVRANSTRGSIGVSIKGL